MQDKDLLERLKKGDHDVFKYVFSQYYEYLCNYIYKLSNDYPLSEDVVQETIFKLWMQREKINIHTSFKSYLFRSCHNQFLLSVRKRKIVFDSLDEIKWETTFNQYQENNEDKEVRYLKIDKLYQDVNKLPPRCKEIFILNKFEKKKYKEIAVDLGISIKTVEAQISKAFRILRENTNLFF